MSNDHRSRQARLRQRRAADINFEKALTTPSKAELRQQLRDAVANTVNPPDRGQENVNRTPDSQTRS